MNEINREKLQLKYHHRYLPILNGSKVGKAPSIPFCSRFIKIGTLKTT